ncbi:MAG TPA: extracellular solute-binding protein, partial [Gemmata sp.]
MQQSLSPNPRNRRRFHALTIIAVGLVLALGALVGCAGPAPPTPGRAPRSHDGLALAFNCPDRAFADAIEPMIRSWEARTGAAVTLTRDPMTPTDATDLAVLPVSALGAWAEPGHLAPLPLRLRGQVSELLPPYAERLAAWGDQTQAVPLTGDGVVLVYRADRFADPATAEAFQARAKRGLAPPATWEQFAEVAAFFADRDKGPSLPPLPADPARLFEFFSRVAACFDRPALSYKELVARVKDEELLAFHFAVRSGTPRLQSPGFTAAAQWLGGLVTAGCVPPGRSDDPVAALAGGRAVLAVLSLDQLAKLPRTRVVRARLSDVLHVLYPDRLAQLPAESGAVPERFGLAGLPGSQWRADPKAKPRDEKEAANYVPYFAGGRLGVVRARCPHPEAAFDLLAELGSPARSAELISTPGLGAGPLRPTDLTPDLFPLWLGYGFDPARSRGLQDALRHYLADTVKNPAFGLRGPDQEALTVAAAGALRELGLGANPAEVLGAAQAAWVALDAKLAAP